MISKQHKEVLATIVEKFPRHKVKTEYHLGEKLFLDIYMPEFSVGVEINGIQHYKYSAFFHGTIDNFEIAKMLDRKKTRLCMELNIGLYVIRYDQRFDISDFMSFVLEHMNSLESGETSIERKNK